MSQVPNSETLNRNSSRTCSFSNSSSHQIERLAQRHGKKVAPELGAVQQGIALGLRQRLGEALRNQDLARDLLGAGIPVAEGLRVARREAGNVGDRLLEVAAEHQRGAVAVRLAELVGRRDVGDPLGQPEVLEPGRLADVEVIDRMQVVVEARQGGFPGAEPAAIVEPALEQENVEPLARQVASEHQPVVAGADDDAVIGTVEGVLHCRSASLRPAFPGIGDLSCGTLPIITWARSAGNRVGERL